VQPLESRQLDEQRSAPVPPGAGEGTSGASPSHRSWRSVVGVALTRYGVIVVWFVTILVFSLLRPETFPTAGNFRTIFGTQVVLLVLTLGLIFPLTVGEFDLSVSGTLSISLVLVGYLSVLHGWPIALAVAVALAAGVIVGLANAFIIVVAGVPSLIATLGTGTILVGLGVGINNLTVAPLSDALVETMRTQLVGLPLAFYYGLGLTAFAWYVLTQTPLGRYFYFVGAGRDVARLSGLRVDALRTLALVIAGFTASLAAVILAGTNGSADPNVGVSFLLPAFAAAFLGSTVFTPGRFNPWGTFVAVYFLVTGITGLQLLGLAGWIEQVFYGSSLVIAVALSRFAERKGFA
jgi:ribose transport system permease protein